ncbi:MAG: tetratricopeptide repeat protein [Myxococcota bacterium]|nr:tetratricopeptide repeat protein [Myxococcota bacterium]
MATFDDGKDDKHPALVDGAPAGDRDDGFDAEVQRLISRDDQPALMNLLQRRLTRRPSDVRAWLLLSRVVEGEEGPARARRFVRRALKSNPGNPDCGLRLSELYLVENRLDDAIKILRRLAYRHADPRLTRRLGELVEARFEDLAAGAPDVKTESINLNEHEFTEALDDDATIQSARLPVGLISTPRHTVEHSEQTDRSQIVDFDRTLEAEGRRKNSPPVVDPIETLARLVEMDETDDVDGGYGREGDEISDADSLHPSAPERDSAITDKPMPKPPMARVTQDDGPVSDHRASALRGVTPTKHAQGDHAKRLAGEQKTDENVSISHSTVDGQAIPSNRRAVGPEEETIRIPGLAAHPDGLNESKDGVTIDAVVRPWSGVPSDGLSDRQVESVRRQNDEPKTEQIPLITPDDVDSRAATETNQPPNSDSTRAHAAIPSAAQVDIKSARIRVDENRSNAPEVGDEPTETTGTPAAILGMEVEQLTTRPPPHADARSQGGAQLIRDEDDASSASPPSRLTERLDNGGGARGIERIQYGDPGQVDIPEAPSVGPDASIEAASQTQSVSEQSGQVTDNSPIQVSANARMSKGKPDSVQPGPVPHHSDQGLHPPSVSDHAMTIDRRQPLRGRRDDGPLEQRGALDRQSPDKFETRSRGPDRSSQPGKPDAPTGGPPLKLAHRPLEDDVPTIDIRGHAARRSPEVVVESPVQEGQLGHALLPPVFMAPPSPAPVEDGPSPPVRFDQAPGRVPARRWPDTAPPENSVMVGP